MLESLLQNQSQTSERLTVPARKIVKSSVLIYDTVRHVVSRAEKIRRFIGLQCFISDLHINTGFSTSMSFETEFTSSKKKMHLNINNIDCKSYIKYLGIYLDEHLQWEPQIQHVNNKLAKNVGIINKLRHYLDFHMLKQLYYTLIYPYLNYAWSCQLGCCLQNEIT